VAIKQGDREQAICEAFVSLADTAVGTCDVNELMWRLTKHCIQLLPVDAGEFLLPGQHLELFPPDFEDGPCLASFTTGRPITVANLLTVAQRWPRFAARADAEGFRSAHAVPLRLRDEIIGAVALLSTRIGLLPVSDLRLCQALADAAAICLVQQRELRHHTVLAGQLQTALDSRVIIEQAKGILAERGRLDMSEAFDRMRAHARNTNQRLNKIAHGVVDGTVPADELLEAAGDRP
jgi:GAF domain-containing protein